MDLSRDVTFHAKNNIINVRQQDNQSKNLSTIAKLSLSNQILIQKAFKPSL